MMRKIGAHFYLTPDGEWGKFPIIELDDAGCILSVREHKDVFKEEPGLEFFSGVFIPGLIENCHFASLEEKSIKSVINRSVVEGVRRFIVPEKFQHLSFSSKIKVEFVSNDFCLQANDVASSWVDLKREVEEGEVLLSQLLSRRTKDLAISSNTYPKWGVIQKGAMPGILLLKNLDLRKMTFTPQTQLKVIVE